MARLDEVAVAEGDDHERGHRVGGEDEREEGAERRTQDLGERFALRGGSFEASLGGRYLGGGR